MSRKHAELEREFIDELPLRTGRSLDEWMAAIAAAGLSEKNAIIDWLRPQGLTFAHASWLERIHNNGGRPIYLGAAGQDLPKPAPTVMRSAVLPPVKAAPETRPAAPPVMPRLTPKLVQPLTTAPASASDLAVLLQRAKGLRPLADMLLREINAALPGVVASAQGDLISLGKPTEFAVIFPGPRELRLGLSLADATAVCGVSPARIPGTGPHITHMLSLNDARQVVPALLELVRQADSHVNGK